MDQSALRHQILIINQIFDLQKKLGTQVEESSLKRNFSRMQHAWQELGFSYEDPTGEAYNETRTDCEASISGTSDDNLVILETLKPIIRFSEDGFHKIVQRALVIVGQKEIQNTDS